MKPPVKAYLVPYVIAIVGILFGSLAYWVAGHFFGQNNGAVSGSVIFFAWFMSTTAGVNYAFKEGVKAASCVKDEKK